MPFGGEVEIIYYPRVQLQTLHNDLKKKIDLHNHILKEVDQLKALREHT